MSAQPLLTETDPEIARIEAQARAWVLRLGEEGSAAEAECYAWRAADPRHARAFDEARGVWGALAQSEFAQSGAWREEAAALSRAARPRRWAVPAAIAACVALAAVFAAPRVIPPPASQVETATAETRTLDLADGSKLFVGGRTIAAVRIGAHGRQVELKDGEAFFEVAHDAARPFTVLAGGAVVRVTGTKFNVRRTADGVQVSVLDGRVEVSKKPLVYLGPPAKPDRVLGPGRLVRMKGDELGYVVAANVEPGAWRFGRLMYADAPLKDVVADANRYTSHVVRLGSAKAGEMRVTLSYRASAADEFMAHIDQALPVKVSRGADGVVVLDAAAE